MSAESITEGFASELEKLGFDPFDAIPALAAVGAGAWGASDPKRFDPSWVNPAWKGNTWKGRVVSGILGATTVSGIAALPRHLAGPFRDEDAELRAEIERIHRAIGGLTHTASAGVSLATSRGGRTAAKSSKIREIFQPRAAAAKAWLDNMRDAT